MQPEPAGVATARRRSHRGRAVVVYGSFLGRPADAMVMFERYGRGSQSPQTRAKGFYWAGRAAEAAGRSAEAAAYYAQAAGYRDQFYGQLALERTGRPLVAPQSSSQERISTT